MPRVLLIEDEEMLARIVMDSLEMRGFSMSYAPDGETGWTLFREQAPDIIVMDVMMPGMDGFSLTRKIREADKDVPILFLTARSRTADVIQGFELGGNDYLRKPFSMDELIVRIRELLKRAPRPAPAAENAVYQLGRYRFDPVRQRLSLDGEECKLSHRESEILRMLCEQRNEVVERSHMLKSLWGDDSFFNARSMDVFITKLRRYLKEDAAVQIVNVRGVGYKLIS
ncbi:response regulator transcription factor [Compostibacter hankyongensis]|uniref:Response regulator transcription factor n=1 Tax=Compostibacter hankyongensis TaxID=1007089 RepID=A0ABP8G0M9_9BACT